VALRHCSDPPFHSTHRPGRPALLGLLPACGFPQEVALEPGGRTLLVSCFASGQVEAVAVARLP
jgi:hypothetical protein